MSVGLLSTDSEILLLLLTPLGRSGKDPTALPPKTWGPDTPNPGLCLPEAS